MTENTYPTKLPVYLTQHVLEEFNDYKYQKEIVQVFVALQMATKAINNEVRSARKNSKFLKKKSNQQPFWINRIHQCPRRRS
jgi:alpha-mannosidase